MHAVNNGPVSNYEIDKGRDDNFEDYKLARIPYARTHDASFCAEFGGEHIVDTHGSRILYLRRNYTAKKMKEQKDREPSLANN